MATQRRAQASPQRRALPRSLRHSAVVAESVCAPAAGLQSLEHWAQSPVADLVSDAAAASAVCD